MCTFNGERYLPEQLESFAKQTRPPDEVVICDDQSSDNTLALIRQFAAAFRVRVESNAQQLGSMKNFEKAIGLCAGDIIVLADQDDVWLSNKLQCLEAEFERAPEVGLVFSDAELIDDEGQGLGRRLWEQIGLGDTERARLNGGNGLIDLLRGATATGATLAFRAKYKSLILPIPENLTVIHDAWIALIVSCVARVLPLDQPLVQYRQHPLQQVGPRRRLTAPGGLGAVVAGQAGDAASRANPYDATLTLARAASARLTEVSREFDGQRAKRQLGAMIKHLEARAHLTQSLVPRMPLVLRELLTLRYWRFSNGISSAVKDLFYGSLS